MANQWVDRIFGACLGVAALIQIASIWGFDYGLAIWSPWAYLVLGVFIYMAAPRRGPRGGMTRGMGGSKVKTYIFLSFLILLVAVLEILEILGVFSLGLSFAYSWIMLLLGLIVAFAPSSWNQPANYQMYGQP